jgi:capsular polysaccharide biosynthesis protein
MKTTYVQPPARCVRLAEIVERDGGVIEGGGTAERTRYALPAHATEEVARYLRGLVEVTRPDQFVARLPRGRLYGAGTVLSAAGDLLARDVSADLGKPFERHWLLGHGKIREPKVLPGATAVAAVNLGAGYCHWLLEELPRILAVGRGAVDNLLVHATAGYAREALAARAGAERVVEVRRAAHWACGPLVVPSLADFPGAPTPATVARIRAWVEERGLGRDVPGRGEKIYITRAAARRRRVANEDALWGELEKRGFAKVALEGLSWAEQIAVFREARVVVAPHGAGLANLVFSEAGARVVELVNRAYFNPVFWRLAALRRLEYHALVAPGEGDLREEAANNSSDIMADLGGLRAVI